MPSSCFPRSGKFFGGPLDRLYTLPGQQVVCPGVLVARHRIFSSGDSSKKAF
jgi:hypothetical protein